MHSLARFWIDRNKAIRRQYSSRFYKEILNEWGLFLMQFFRPHLRPSLQSSSELQWPLFSLHLLVGEQTERQMRYEIKSTS